MIAPFALHLMRHGAPEGAGRMLGRTDRAATPAGIAACVAQAERLGARRILSSDLGRALACAHAVGGDGVRADPRWRELDFGAWDGLPIAEIEEAPLWAFRADPERAPPPGGERWSSLCARVGDAVAALDPVDTLVVTHGGAIRAALTRLCGFSYDQAWRIELPYAVVVSLNVWPEPPRGAQITAIRPCAG